MKTIRVTDKNRYVTLIDLINENVTNSDEAADLVEFCERKIAQLDKKAASARAAAEKRKTETDELTDVVRTVLTDEFTTIADVTKQIDGDDVTPSKVQYRLNKLVSMGLAEKGEVTIPGGEGVKARKLVAFRTVATE